MSQTWYRSKRFLDQVEVNRQINSLGRTNAQVDDNGGMEQDVADADGYGGEGVQGPGGQEQPEEG